LVELGVGTAEGVGAGFDEAFGFVVSAYGAADAIAGFIEREGNLVLVEVPGGTESGDASSNDGYALHRVFVLIRSVEQNIFL
jgi:hypothetical protein